MDQVWSGCWPQEDNDFDRFRGQKPGRNRAGPRAWKRGAQKGVKKEGKNVITKVTKSDKNLCTTEKRGQKSGHKISCFRRKRGQKLCIQNTRTRGQDRNIRPGLINRGKKSFTFRDLRSTLFFVFFFIFFFKNILFFCKNILRLQK